MTTCIVTNTYMQTPVVNAFRYMRYVTCYIK